LWGENHIGKQTYMNTARETCNRGSGKQVMIFERAGGTCTLKNHDLCRTIEIVALRPEFV